ncbi:hypothetical protein KP78_23570 [Jeotgalibacillus soli]|uniref:Uncharacterized protein n=1 Tax=Jeotgalibacillus soli TaxID=889306 RepID=A0A0C2VLD3_9BACL|nr:hypothetical protein KP78_23570 [Jeotgalibacillus soli]
MSLAHELLEKIILESCCRTIYFKQQRIATVNSYLSGV